MKENWEQGLEKNLKFTENLFSVFLLNSHFSPAALTPINHHYGTLPHWLEKVFASCAEQVQSPASPCRGRTWCITWNKQQQWQDKKDFDRERLMVANGEVSQSQPHACQTPKPHLSSVALSPWCRLLVKGTSSSVQQARRCGGEEVKTSFFITHFRKGERKIRKSRPQYSLD